MAGPLPFRLLTISRSGFDAFFGTLSGCVSVFGSTPGDLVFECLRLFMADELNPALAF